MPDINLLPENLRNREEKELKQAAKRPKVFEIDLTSRAKIDPPDLKSSRPKESWWSRIFGAKKPVGKLSPHPGQPVLPATDKVKVDLLKAAKKAPIQAVTEKLTSNNQAKAPRDHWRPSEFLEKSEKKEQSRASLNPPKFNAPPKPPLPPLIQAKSEVSRPEAKIRQFTPQKSGNSWFKDWRLRRARQRQLSKTVPLPRASASIRPATPVLPSAPPSYQQMENSRQTLIKESVKIEKKSWWRDFWNKLFGRGRPKIKPVFRQQKNSSRLAPVAPRPTAGAAENKKIKDGPSFHFTPRVQPDAGLDINLIPRELIAVEHHDLRQRFLVLGLTAVAAAGVVGLLFYSLRLAQAQVDKKIAAYQQQVAEISQALAGYQEEQRQDALAQQRLLTLKALLSQHVYWSNFFEQLEKYTLDGVYYTDFSGDISGNFVLPAVATNYAKAAEQIVALQKDADFITRVDAESAKILSQENQGVVGVTLDLKIQLNPKVFQTVLTSQ